MFQPPDFSFIHKYFLAEKQAGLYFMLIGGAAIVMGLVAFFFLKQPPGLFKGLAIPFVLIGLIQGIVGLTV